MITILSTIITISSLIYKHEGQINGLGWDGTVINYGRSGRNLGQLGGGGLGGGDGGGSW